VKIGGVYKTDLAVWSVQKDVSNTWLWDFPTFVQKRTLNRMPRQYKINLVQCSDVNETLWSKTETRLRPVVISPRQDRDVHFHVWDKTETLQERDFYLDKASDICLIFAIQFADLWNGHATNFLLSRYCTWKS